MESVQATPNLAGFRVIGVPDNIGELAVEGTGGLEFYSEGFGPEGYGLVGR